MADKGQGRGDKFQGKSDKGKFDKKTGKQFMNKTKKIQKKRPGKVSRM